MFIVDDPMLALIMRFVGGDRQLDISDEKFLHGQITAVQEFVSKYPSEQKNSKALEWIAKYARKYERPSFAGEFSAGGFKDLLGRIVGSPNPAATGTPRYNE